MAEDEWAPDGFNLDEALRAIDTAEVLVVGFGWLAQRLLVDARRTESAGPYVRIVEPVRSAQERLRQLQELRPGFADPESFLFFPWPGRVDSFVRAGLFSRIRERCRDDAQAERDCDRTLQQLEALDRDDLRQAILGGEKYHTLYQQDNS